MTLSREAEDALLAVAERGELPLSPRQHGCSELMQLGLVDWTDRWFPTTAGKTLASYIRREREREARTDGMARAGNGTFPKPAQLDRLAQQTEAKIQQNIDSTPHQAPAQGVPSADGEGASSGSAMPTESEESGAVGSALSAGPSGQRLPIDRPWSDYPLGTKEMTEETRQAIGSALQLDRISDLEDECARAIRGRQEALARAEKAETMLAASQDRNAEEMEMRLGWTSRAEQAERERGEAREPAWRPMSTCPVPTHENPIALRRRDGEVIGVDESGGAVGAGRWLYNSGSRGGAWTQDCVGWCRLPRRLADAATPPRAETSKAVTYNG